MTASSAAGLLASIVGRLDALAIDHMLVGSFASTFHGEPRTTQDLDLVIDAGREQLDRLLADLDPEQFYVDVDADVAREALRRRTMFNIIEIATAWRLDIVIRKARPFSIEEMRRRQPAVILGVAVNVATAEDVIISKLEWSKVSGSDRQLHDVAGILRVRSAALDRAYVARWVAALGLDERWGKAQELSSR